MLTRSAAVTVRAILAEAVREPADSAGLFTTLLDRFGALGGIDLDMPGRERAGKPIAGFGALIAAVCRSQGAALATRNGAGFDGTGIEIIDPWLQ
jgi:hypothetical protein